MNKAVWGLALGQTLLWCCLYYVFPAMLLHWEQVHDWSRSEFMLGLTLAVGVSAIAALPAGRLIDKGYGALMMTVSAVIGGLLLFLVSLVEQLAWFYLLWGLMGIAMAGCLYEPCFAFLIRSLKTKAKRAITMITLVAGFASTICFPTVHYLAQHYGLTVTLQIFAGVVLFVAAPLLFINTKSLARFNLPSNAGALPQVPPTVSQGSSDRFSSASYLSNPMFWLLACGFSMLALNHGVVLNHLLPLLDERNVPDDLAILVISLIGPMQVAGRVMWLLVDKHWSIMRITVACFMSICCATLCLILSENVLYLVFGFVLLQGSAYGVMSIVKPLTTREVMGEANFGSLAGAMAVPYLLAFALSPYFGAVIWQMGGYQWVLWSIFGSAVVGFVSIVTVSRLHLARSQPSLSKI
ncbi:MFS transporter [Vibrio sp. 10N.261.46.A3]|uniref:MFS transporter n=1 Tax=Vibrio sp. 10N.261.46.A3 TaxID=3229658 RepID=UPI0035529557